jgi:hypothetical protein
MNTVLTTQIEIQKDALMNSRQVQSNIELDGHQNAVILEVQKFGFSANNITYALLGERFGYWGFFPASEGYGITPVWGFAKVVQTNTEQLKIGELVYGYLPMATHLLIHADKISEQGFTDVHPQRKSISPVYDHYLRCNADPTYAEVAETWILTFRPLFTTSFVLAYALADRMQAHKGNVFLTSASSKTAYGTAQILRIIMPDVRLVGLTSEGQVDFVNQTGCYDDVLSYDEIDSHSVGEHDWLLDFAGDQVRLNRLRNGHKLAMERTLLIGATDVEAQGFRDKLAIGGVFFAPDEVRKFNKEWGPTEFQKRYFQHWQSFVKHFKPLLNEQSESGALAIIDQFQQFLNGKVNPKMMHVLTF